MAPMMAKMYGEGMAGMMSASQRWIAIASGENGFSTDVGPGKMEMSGVLHVDDPAAMRAIWAELMAAMAKAKGGATVVTVGSATYKGVKLSTFTVALGPDATAEQRAAFAAFGAKLTYGFAVVGDSAVFAMGGSGLVRIKALIDQVRAGKKPKVTASAGLRAALADARGRHESYVVAFDVAAVMARLDVLDLAWARHFWRQRWHVFATDLFAHGLLHLVSRAAGRVLLAAHPRLRADVDGAAVETIYLFARHLEHVGLHDQLADRLCRGGHETRAVARALLLF